MPSVRTVDVDLRHGAALAARHETATHLAPITVDGKFFRAGTDRFHFHGATYGTFLPRDDKALYPETPQLLEDLRAMAAHGFTVVRTYTTPPDDLLGAAAEQRLRILAGSFFADWRYLVGASKREVRRIMAEARRVVVADATRLHGRHEVLGICLGNEIPADVVRWLGVKTIAGAIDELAQEVRQVDPERLVTYANYPTAEYLLLHSLDFLTFNVFLEQKADFRRYLTRLQNLAGDRPLVLGEIGLHSQDEQRQADLIDWQLETALERGVAGTCLYSWTDEWAVGGKPVEGWQFGLTRADRSPRPSLDVARTWNAMEIADLREAWPSVSVVVCAYNAADTLDECLRHTCALDYPELEIIVVDDGSTDATAEIVRRHPRARLVSIEHAGLSTARNAGADAATGDIVAYLDADAYPSPEWLYYLTLAFDSRTIGGAGGPNVPPADDPIGAHRVARSPGGPVHVLVADDRAEHVPGCNMAFWRDVLMEIGGFDPIFTSAGDDVDVCWKVLDRGWEIGFHPAALVWHRRRPGLRAYLRQQRGYGRSEALVEARHPDRFTPAGSARWRGRIYNPLVTTPSQQRIYRGLFGTASYQSVYQGGGHALDLAHQLGIPFSLGLLPFGLLGALSPMLAVPALAGALFCLGLFLVDAVRTTPPRGLSRGRRSFRASVALHHLLQPIVRTWGRSRTRMEAWADARRPPPLPEPLTVVRGGVLLMPATKARAEIAADVIGHLRHAGYRVLPPSGWEAYDARLVTSWLTVGDVVTTGHVEGTVQLRIIPRARWRRCAAAAALTGAVAGLHAFAGLALAGAVVLTLVSGHHRSGRGARGVLLAVSRPAS